MDVWLIRPQSATNVLVFHRLSKCRLLRAISLYNLDVPSKITFYCMSEESLIKSERARTREGFPEEGRGEADE